MNDTQTIEQLGLGDQLRLSGDYEYPAKWLHGREFVRGKVAKWINHPQSDKPLCLVELDELFPFISKDRDALNLDGRFLLLKLRFREDSWRPHGVVNVFVFSTHPNEASSTLLRKSWVASHAEYWRE
jgi:hypothetical protein